MLTRQRTAQGRINLHVPLGQQLRVDHHGDVVDLTLLVIQALAAAPEADAAGAFIDRMACVPATVVKAAMGLALEAVGEAEVDAFAVVLQWQLHRLRKGALPAHEVQPAVQGHAGDPALVAGAEFAAIAVGNDLRDRRGCLNS